MTSRIAKERLDHGASARQGRTRIGWLTLAAVGLLLCGGWTSNIAAARASLTPAIVVRPRPVDDTSIFQQNGREIGLGAGAVLTVGFFLRRMTRRGGE